MQHNSATSLSTLRVRSEILRRRGQTFEIEASLKWDFREALSIFSESNQCFGHCRKSWRFAKFSASDGIFKGAQEQQFQFRHSWHRFVFSIDIASLELWVGAESTSVVEEDIRCLYESTVRRTGTKCLSPDSPSMWKTGVRPLQRRCCMFRNKE
jgi:hypothetical protein